MKFIDFFAGIGGFRRGMELAGHECVGFCEFDKFAVASYTAMHLMTEQEREYISTLPKTKRVAEAIKEEYRHEEWYAADVQAIRADDIPRADCWCFGFPCQDISVAGKQIGFAGSRSSLFFAVTRLIRDTEEENRPTYLFIENVKNLLSVNRGFDFAKLLIELDEIGYDAEWQVVNSADYVPQNRERVFVIGHLRGRSGRKIFPVERADRKNSVQIIGHRDGYRRNTQVFDVNGITEALSTCQSGGREHHVAVIAKINDSQDGKIYDIHGMSQCISAGNNNNPKIAVPVLIPDRADKRQNGRRMKENSEDMFTLTGQDRHEIGIEIAGILRNVRTEYGKKIRKDYEAGKIDISRHKFLESEIREDGIVNTLSTVQKDNLLAIKVREGKEKDGLFVKISDVLTVYAVWYEKYQCYIAIRKLTPKECFRLQGWEDEYFNLAELVNSDSQLYKQAGNGVTVPVIKEIAERMDIDE